MGKFTSWLMVGLLFVTACATQHKSKSESLTEKLQHGGYVIFFRHAATNPEQMDTDLANPTNCKAQRRLSILGKQQAKDVGEAFTELGIPVGDVITSQFCRCSNTALIAFNKAKPTIDITSIQGVTPNERLKRISNIKTMLNTQPKPNTNTVLVSHKLMFRDASGYILEEAEAAIFKPQSDDDGPLFVQKVKADHWKSLKNTGTDK